MEAAASRCRLRESHVYNPRRRRAVVDSPVVAVQANVTAWPGSKDVVLACRTVLGEAIQYCRFLRPDGSSVHVADAHLPHKKGVY